MNGAENVAAVAFYLGLGGTIGGAIMLARTAVERRASGNRVGIVLLVVGLAAIAGSIAVYLTGPRRMLPF